MNPLYEQMFNPEYVNEEYVNQIRYNQFHAEQQEEIIKAVRAIHDYFDAVSKIAPEYQTDAFRQCAMAALEEMRKTNVI